MTFTNVFLSFILMHPMAACMYICNLLSTFFANFVTVLCVFSLNARQSHCYIHVIFSVPLKVTIYKYLK